MRAEGVKAGTPPAAEPPDAGRLRQVAQDFEAMILSQMLATMRRAGGQSTLGGKGQQIYQEMLDDELGRTLARSGGLGLADVLVRDLIRQTPAPKKASSSEPDESMNTPNGGVTLDRRVGDSQ
jgi:Rod binding domain-containing protein